MNRRHHRPAAPAPWEPARAAPRPGPDRRGERPWTRALDLQGNRLQQRYLRPGELHVATRPTVVTTVLGSCVSVTMFAHRLGVGAISHTLLPEGEMAAEQPGAFRYPGTSVQAMLRRLDALGVDRDELEVKAFGGADVLAARAASARASIGRQNLDATLAVVAAAGLRLAAQDLGGARGRKLVFYTDTGEVFVRRLGRPRGG